MRKDILNAIEDLKGVKKMINKSELARRFGCSINTVNKYMEIQKTDEKVYSTSELSPDPSISSFSNNFHPLHILYKKERSTGYLAKR